MTWLFLIKTLISLADRVAKYVTDRQLIEAGEAKALSKALNETLERIQDAKIARNSVNHDTDSMRGSKYNRDLDSQRHD